MTATSPAGRYSKLEVSLDNPNRLHAPGDTITGSLSGWNPNTAPKSLVHIILEGRSKTYMYIDGHMARSYKDRSPLLYQVTHLQLSCYDEGTQKARFTITVPETVPENLSSVAALKKDTSYWTHHWTPLQGFEHKGGYGLPPSMVMRKRNIRGITSKVFGWGYIRYTLTAVRTEISIAPKTTEQGRKIPPKLNVTGSAQHPVYITVARKTIDEVEELKAKETSSSRQDLTIATKRFDPSIGNRPPTFMENLRGTFRDSPYLRVRPVFSLPKVAVIGDNLRMSVKLHVLPRFTYEEKKEYDFPIPPISLVNLTMRLKDSIGIRCNGHVRDNHQYDFGGPSVMNKSYRPSHTYNPTADGKSYEDTACEVEFPIPSSCTPTHSTCNFNNKWNVKGEATFRCYAKLVTAEYKAEVQLVPRPRRKGANIDGQSEAVASMETFEDKDEDGDDSEDVLEMAAAILVEEIDLGGALFDLVTSLLEG